MKNFATSLCLLASVSSVLGHATFQQLWVDDVDQAKTCVRDPPSNSPVSDVTSQDIVCNVNGAKGVPGICAVNAGSKITVEMHQHNDRDCAKEAIGGAHHGPTIIYMSKVTDATTVSGAEGTWFKVAEDGYDPATGAWGDTLLNANCGKRDFVVPSDLASGDYLIRAEVIALHAAGSPNGAQLYMSCYQIHVEGTGSATPQGVKFPGAYSATDPGILINIYQQIDDYIIPGPVDIYSAGGSGGSSPAPTTSRPVAVQSSTAVASSTSVATSSTAAVTTRPATSSAALTSAAPITTHPTSSVTASSNTQPPTPAPTTAPVEDDDCE